MEFRLDRAIDVLRRTPGVLRSLLTDLDADWTHANYGEGTDRVTSIALYFTCLAQRRAPPRTPRQRSRISTTLRFER